MSSRYLDMARRQRRERRPWRVTAKAIMGFLAVVAILGSGAYWWQVQSSLTPDRIVAVVFTVILVLAPPALTSFLIPWTPAGMLLHKLNRRTYGYLAIVVCALYLLYYSFQIQWAWWQGQPVVAESNLVYQQVLIGIIGFIAIPALIWTPVTDEELIERIRQDQLVKRYELQTQADINILRATLLRAQEKALLGFANLTLDEREELAGVMRGLVSGLDGTLQQIGDSVKAVSGATIPFQSLEDNDDIRDVLDYITAMLKDSTLNLENAQAAEGETQALIAAPRRVPTAIRYLALGDTPMQAPVLEYDPHPDGMVIVQTRGGRDAAIPKARITDYLDANGNPMEV